LLRLQYDQQGFAHAEDGTRLFWGVRGTGRPGAPAIVLCDGIGCDGFAWTYLQPHLAAQHRVVHWNYRGHGRSGFPVDRDRIDVVQIARDLRSVLDHLKIRDVVAIGHSMGTQVALELYRLEPERTRALVLLCGSYGRVTRTFHGSDMLEQVLPTLIEQARKHRGLARAIWQRVPPGLAFRIARMSKEVDALAIREEDFRHYMEHVAAMDPDLFLEMLQKAGEHTAEDLLPNVEVPVLVIAAERDSFTPCALAEAMAKAIPGAEHRLLVNGTHAAPVEQPGRIVEWIDAFLAQRVPLAEPREPAVPKQV
jgi:pimeloyl-ACP methyl ester carboxylesterase